MKKIIALLLAVVLMLSGAVMVSAYTPGMDDGEISAGEIFGQVSVDFDDATVTAGETVDVVLSANNNSGFTKLVVTFALDDGIVLHAVAAAAGFTAAKEGNVVTVTAANTVADDGAVATLTFAADADASGKKTVAMELAAMDGDKEVKAAASNGYITVKEFVEEPAVKGDIDGNGAVNVGDLAILKKVIAGLTALDDPTVINPDVDGTGGTPNAADLATLKKIIAGL